MGAIHQLLADAGFSGTWEITRSGGGATGRAFLARRHEQAVIIKVGAAHPAYRRLSELGVTPPLLSLGVHDGMPYSIHEAVVATRPSPVWIADHLMEIVDLIAGYQGDDVLPGLIGPTTGTSLQRHLVQEIDRMGQGIAGANDPRFRGPEVRAAVDRLVRLPPTDAMSRLVPAHTDPNTSNILVAPDRSYLIDWDGVTLSDPLRDIGLVLWWYVPEQRWADALSRMTRGTVDRGASWRIFWWAAVTSIWAALWVDRHASDATTIASFVEDAIAAADRQPNPKRVS